MQDAGISYTAWCVGIVKAAVLAKFMLLGRAANIGTRYQHMALIWPTLHMVFGLVAYSMIWSLLGYTKQIAKQQPWWKFWGDSFSYPKVRVMGGRLKPEARSIIQSKGITTQEFLEGNAYNQDRVWTRGSRTCAQALLILMYIAVVLFYVATIAVPAT